MAATAMATGAGNTLPPADNPLPADAQPQPAEQPNAEELLADAEVARVFGLDDMSAAERASAGKGLLNNKVLEMTSHWGGTFGDDEEEDGKPVGFVNFKDGERDHRSTAAAVNLAKFAIEADDSRNATPAPVLSDRDLEEPRPADGRGTSASQYATGTANERTHDVCMRLIKLQMRRQIRTDERRRDGLMKEYGVSNKGRERANKILGAMDVEVGLVNPVMEDVDGDGDDDWVPPTVHNPHPATQLRPITAPKGFAGRPATSMEAALTMTRLSNPAPRQDLLAQRFEDRMTVLQLKMLERRLNGDALELGNAGVTMRHVSMLSTCLMNNPQISKLDLSDNGLEDDVAETLVDALVKVGGITHLDLNENNFTHIGLNALVRLLKVEEVGSARTIEETRHFNPDGSRSAAVFHLEMQDNELSDEGARMIATVIEENFQLQKLNIAECKINEEGATYLGWMIHENQSIESISLAWNNLGSDRGARALAEGMRFNRTLTHVDLSHIGLRDSGGQYIADVLEENATITHLDLGGNSLGEEACMVMAAALSGNKTLSTLDMQGNPLGFTGATILLRAFSKSLSLTSVNLTRCTFLLDENSKAVAFDPENPKGDYRLDLSVTLHYEIAEQLVELYNTHGPKCWPKCTFNGKNFVLTEEMHWPERMPEKGILKVSVRPPAKGTENMRALSQLEFENVFLEMDFSRATDEWKVSYVELLANSCFFTAKQAAQIVKIFGWVQDKVDAAVLMFSRIVDPDNMVELEHACSAREWNAVMNALGVLARFHVANLSNYYILNLERPVDRSIARRLQVAYSNEMIDGVTEGPKEHRGCWRNVQLDNVNLLPRLRDGEFLQWKIPFEGWLEVDFVSYRFPPKGAKAVDDALCNELVKLLEAKELDEMAIVRWFGTLEEWTREGGESLAKKMKRRALRGLQPMTSNLVDKERAKKPAEAMNASLYAFVKPGKDDKDDKVPHEVDYDAAERDERLDERVELTPVAPVVSSLAGGDQNQGQDGDEDIPRRRAGPASASIASRPIESELERHEVARDLVRAIEKFNDTKLDVAGIPSSSWSMVSVRSVDAGGFLGFQGDPADEAFFIISGTCEILKDYDAKFRTGGVRLSEIAEGQFGGELALFCGKTKRLSTLHCLTDVMCYVLPKAFLAELFSANPEAAKKTKERAMKKLAGDSLEVALSAEQQKRFDSLLSTVRLLTIKTYVTTDQVEHFMKSRHCMRPSQRAMVMQACFTRIVDRNNISNLMRHALGPSGQMLLGEKVGWMNLLDVANPGGLTYRLRLERGDEYKAACKLVNLAVRGGGDSNMERIKVNGKFTRHPEDKNMWTFLRGELDRKRNCYTNVLEFYFNAPSEDQELVNAAVLVQTQWRRYSARKHSRARRFATFKIQMICLDRLLSAGRCATKVRDRWTRMRLNATVKAGKLALMDFLRQSYVNRSAYAGLYNKYWTPERLGVPRPDESGWLPDDHPRKVDGKPEMDHDA